MFVLILSAAALTNYDNVKVGDHVRVVVISLNALLTLVTVGVFELRQLLIQRWAYFKSFWNFNDLVVFILAIGVAVLEIYFLATSDDEEDSRRNLIKRNKGSSSIVTVITDNGAEEITVDPLNLQVIRMLYAFLILTSFFKIL